MQTDAVSNASSLRIARTLLADSHSTTVQATDTIGGFRTCTVDFVDFDN